MHCGRVSFVQAFHAEYLIFIITHRFTYYNIYRYRCYMSDTIFNFLFFFLLSISPWGGICVQQQKQQLLGAAKEIVFIL